MQCCKGKGDEFECLLSNKSGRSLKSAISQSGARIILELLFYMCSNMMSRRVAASAVQTAGLLAFTIRTCEIKSILILVKPIRLLPFWDKFIMMLYMC